MCFPHSGHILLSFHSFLPAVGVAWRTNRQCGVIDANYFQTARSVYAEVCLESVYAISAMAWRVSHADAAVVGKCCSSAFIARGM